MPEQPTSTPAQTRLPGLDAEATPVIGVGLGLTGLVLGVRPRLAAWPLALTAVAALLYRDPKRVTPADPAAVFSPADGTVIGIDELYEHRFLHTDAVRIAIAVAPFDVPVQRCPAAGTVAYLEHVPGEYRSIWDMQVSDANERQYIGVKTAWGPLLLTLVAGPLARRINCDVGVGQMVGAGSRIGKMRFGGRVDLVLPCDEVAHLPAVGEHLRAGVSRIGRIN
ncbi:MAG TPA: phosphatidylserine decarboxylase [Roseiflexaceae bacterium]|nr:phosphatidylserine decarboxylase [Roseiflexaceae bacterium]